MSGNEGVEEELVGTSSRNEIAPPVPPLAFTTSSESAESINLDVSIALEEILNNVVASASPLRRGELKRGRGTPEFAHPHPKLGVLAVEVGSEASNESTPTPSVIPSSGVAIPPRRKRRRRGELPSINCNHFDAEGVGCKQRAIFGYQFCIRHILQDPNAPYKRCEFVRKPRSKREAVGEQCTNAIRKDGEDILCSTHLIMKGLREPKKKRKNVVIPPLVVDPVPVEKESEVEVKEPSVEAEAVVPEVAQLHPLEVEIPVEPVQESAPEEIQTSEVPQQPQEPEPAEIAAIDDYMEVDEDEEGEELFEDAEDVEDDEDDEEEENEYQYDTDSGTIPDDENQQFQASLPVIPPRAVPVVPQVPQFRPIQRPPINLPPLYIYVDPTDRKAFEEEFDEKNLDVDRLIRVIRERQSGRGANLSNSTRMQYIPRFIEQEESEESEEESDGSEDGSEGSESSCDSDEYSDDDLEFKYSEEELMEMMVREMENEADEWVDQRTKLSMSDREEVNAQESCLHELIACDTMSLHGLLKDKGLDLPPQMLHNWRLNLCERMTNIHSGNIQEKALMENPKLARKIIQSGTVEPGAYTGDQIYKALPSNALPIQGTDPKTSSSARKTKEGMIRMDQRRQPRKMVGAYRMIPEVDDVCRMMEDQDADKTDLFPLGLEPSDDEDEGDFVPFVDRGIISSERDASTIERYIATRELAYEKGELAKKAAYGAKLMEAARKYPNSIGQALIHRNEKKGTEPYSVPPDGTRRCHFRSEEEGERCPRICLPYTNHCAQHMVCNVDQRMYTFCTHSMCRRAVNPVDSNMWNGKCERHRDHRDEVYGYGEGDGEGVETEGQEEGETTRVDEEEVETEEVDGEDEEEGVDQMEVEDDEEYVEEKVEEIQPENEEDPESDGSLESGSVSGSDSEFDDEEDDGEDGEFGDDDGEEDGEDEEDQEDEEEGPEEDQDYDDSSSSEGDGAP